MDAVFGCILCNTSRLSRSCSWKSTTTDLHGGALHEPPLLASQSEHTHVRLDHFLAGLVKFKFSTRPTGPQPGPRLHMNRLIPLPIFHFPLATASALPTQLCGGPHAERNLAPGRRDECTKEGKKNGQKTNQQQLRTGLARLCASVYIKGARENNSITPNRLAKEQEGVWW